MNDKDIEIEVLRAQRDEARREVCREVAFRLDPLEAMTTPYMIAEQRGWDCFKDER